VILPESPEKDHDHFRLRLRVDNGPENVAGAMLQWSVDHNVRLHLIDPSTRSTHPKTTSLLPSALWTW
jgi:hypothetical protein